MQTERPTKTVREIAAYIKNNFAPKVAKIFFFAKCVSASAADWQEEAELSRIMFSAHTNLCIN